MRIILLFIFIFSLNIIISANNSFLKYYNLSFAHEDAIVLHDETTFIINDSENAEYFYTKSILIKNRNAEGLCKIFTRGSKFIEIDEIEAAIFDTLGNKIKELDSDEIKEAEASLNNFYSGHVYNYFELTHHSYPYILKYTIRKNYNTLFFWPDWYPQSDIPTTHSSYKLINEVDIVFNYQPINVEIEPDIKIIDDGKVYKWELEDIPKFESEDFMPPRSDYYMKVLFKSLEFNLEDYFGNSEDWKNFGLFYNKLTDDRYELPEKAKKEIDLLVKGINNKYELVKTLYKSLQSKNRYVDIEMGINGWQPQRASDVFVNRYGDCKDLSTYMIAMLRHAGLEAYPALAKTRSSGEVVENFPMSQFNHCIAMVPIEKDTMWLECTASYLDVEDTPYNIENISTLVVNETGGILIKTPQKTAKNNMAKTIISGKLVGEGTLEYTANIIALGNQKNYLKNNLSVKNDKEDKEYIQSILNDNYTNVYVNNFQIGDANDKKDFNITVDGEYKKFINNGGKRIFINPAIYNRKLLSSLPKEDVEKRKFPIFYRYPFVDIDSVNIIIPTGFDLESIPKSVAIETEFAKFSANYYFFNDTLSYSRYYEQKKNTIPVENYSEHLEFLESMVRADKAKFVFKRK